MTEQQQEKIARVMLTVADWEGTIIYAIACGAVLGWIWSLW